MCSSIEIKRHSLSYIQHIASRCLTSNTGLYRTRAYPERASRWRIIITCDAAQHCYSSTFRLRCRSALLQPSCCNQALLLPIPPQLQPILPRARSRYTTQNYTYAPQPHTTATLLGHHFFRGSRPPPPPVMMPALLLPIGLTAPSAIFRVVPFFCPGANFDADSPARPAGADPDATRLFPPSF